MHALQKAHIHTVLQVAQQHILNEAALQHDDLIRQSWLRCVLDHKLDPTRMQEAVILPHERYREHQDQMEGPFHLVLVLTVSFVRQDDSFLHAGRV